MSGKTEEGRSEGKIGQLFLEHEFITGDELDRALQLRLQLEESRLGSLLVEMGYVTIEQLLTVLQKRFGIPGVNLGSLTLQPAVLNILPLAVMKKFRAVAIANTDKLYIAMTNPGDLRVQNQLEFALGKAVQPVVAPHAQVMVLLKHLETIGGKLAEPLVVKEILSQPGGQGRAKRHAGIPLLLKWLVKENASDLFITAGVAPCLKKNNEIVRHAGPNLMPADIADMVDELVPEHLRREFDENHDIDFGKTIPELGRFRINIFKQRNSMSIAIRSMLEEIPSLEELGLPEWVGDYALKREGLIIVSGPTGHGKSTTLAAMIDLINSRRKCNIITIEDPIEYHHRHKLSNVNQREVGRDTASFPQGLRHIFRQSPDVIVIGEMRDPETFSIALQAAGTGHLVLSTLHANNVAENFLMILNQRLMPEKNGNGRVLALEKLANSQRIKNLIREGKVHHIRSLFKQSSEEFQSLDICLARLVREGKVSLHEAEKYCENLPYLAEMVATKRRRMPDTGVTP
ncbi:MAG: Flp pilus assembly complex ATPase component TadA [Geobacter sp.]|nr:Flp pilus assembly complex ATPase component TadA [Geobacter sp.]